MTFHDIHPLARPSSQVSAEPTPDGLPQPSGVDVATVHTDTSEARFFCTIPGWTHPELEYERRHANRSDSDLRAIPDFSRTAPSHYQPGRYGRGAR